MSIYPKTMIGRLALISISPPMFCMLALGLFVAFQQTQTATETAKTEATLITTGLASSILNPLVESNYVGIDQIVNQVASTTTTVDRILVVNVRGLALVDAHKNSVNGEWKLTHGQAITTPEQTVAKQVVIDEHIVNWMPLTAGSQIGWVETELSLEQIHQSQQLIIKQTAAVLFMASLLSIIFVLLIARKPKQRIASIIKFIDDLPKAHGEQMTFDPAGSEELRGMISSINVASTSLYNNTQQLKILHALIEASADPFYIADAEQSFRLTFVNDAASLHFGYAKDILLTTNIQDYDLELDEQKIKDIFVIIKEQKHITFTSKHRNALGEIIPVKITANYINIANQELVGGYFRDLRADIEAEQQLISALEGAEQAAKSKGAFLTNMSHEIRTPMNGILGLTELALHQDLSPKLSDYLQKIYSSGKSLLLILNDILDFSKLEASGMHIENQVFCLNDVLHNLRDLFSISAEVKQLKLSFDIDTATPVYLVGDALRLTQILANLISNAIKFTNQGTITFKVELKALENTKALIAFSVKDTGLGINTADLAKLFQPFSQVDSSMTRRFGGTGLGLAISQSLLKLMDSELNVISQPSLGSQFSFEVLLGVSSINMGKEQKILDESALYADNSILKVSEVNHNEVNFQGISILVAEDNSINQKVVSELLKLSGMSVVIADNGQIALEKLQQQAFDAVLMDIQMPVMDGLEATRQIRLQPAFAQLPIIALTAGVTIEEQASYKAAGMNDFLPKPINSEALINVLNRTISASQLSKTSLSEPLSLPDDKDWTDLAEALPGFDLENIKFIVGGQREVLLSFLQEFYTESKGESLVVADLLRQGDNQAAQRIVHTLKGVSGSLGAMQLHTACDEFSNQLKLQCFEPATLEHWQAVFEQTMSSIKALNT